MSTSAVRNPVTYVSRRLATYRRLLFDPPSFYEDLGTRRIRKEFLLVLVVGGIGSAMGYYAMTQLFEVVTLDEPTTMRLWRIAVSPLVGAFLLWFGATTVYYVISWYYTNAGSYYHLLKNTAWSLVPFLGVNLLRGAGVVIAASTLPEDPGWATELEGMVSPESQANFVWDQILGDPLVVGLTLLGYAFVVWSGYIAAHGVAEVRHLERDEAYRVVAGPVALYVAYSAGRLFGVL